MMVTESGLISSFNNLWHSPASLFVKKKNKNVREFENGRVVISVSGKAKSKGRDLGDYGDEDSTDQNEKHLKISNATTFARSAVAVLGLGFIDAGYSGDWSRIGVISKESEELLKVAAFLVVPLCLFFIFSFSKHKTIR